MFTFNELCELLGKSREETLAFVKDGIQKGTITWKQKEHGSISYPVFDIEGCFEYCDDRDNLGDPSEMTEWHDFDPDC